jgi:hypothetical protein
MAKPFIEQIHAWVERREELVVGHYGDRVPISLFVLRHQPLSE